MSRQELDKTCEDYLQNTFGESVDFAIERSLPELLDDGLIIQDAQVCLSPWTTLRTCCSAPYWSASSHRAELAYQIQVHLFSSQKGCVKFWAAGVAEFRA